MSTYFIQDRIDGLEPREEALLPFARHLIWNTWEFVLRADDTVVLRVEIEFYRLSIDQQHFPKSNRALHKNQEL